MQKLTRQEEETMLIIWRKGEGSVKLFLDDFPDPKPPYTTLASIIKKLEQKGYVKSTLTGNAYVYKPAVSERDYTQKFMNGFVKDYFDNSYKALVNFFVAQKKLTPQELKEIISMIENK